MMTKRLEILVDLDDTVVNTSPVWVDIYNHTMKPDDAPELAIEDLVNRKVHLAVPSEVGTRVYSIIDRDGFFRGLPPLPGAIAALRDLQKAGHDVVICSAPARNPVSAADKIVWCKQHLPFISTNDVIITKAKHRIGGDVLIDDHAANQAAWLMRHHRGLVAQINWAHNSESLAHVKADSWRDPEAAWGTILEEVLRFGERG
jgi:5'(3')-deoxyribonucleotidase